MRRSLGGGMRNIIIAAILILSSRPASAQAGGSSEDAPYQQIIQPHEPVITFTCISLLCLVSLDMVIRGGICCAARYLTAHRSAARARRARRRRRARSTVGKGATAVTRVDMLFSPSCSSLTVQ